MEGWKLDTLMKICPNTNNTAVDCEKEFIYNLKTLSRDKSNILIRDQRRLLASER